MDVGDLRDWIFAVLGSPKMLTKMTPPSSIYRFVFFWTQLKITRSLFISSWPKMLGSKMHQSSGRSGVVLFPPSDDSGFWSAICLSPAIWPFFLVVLDAATWETELNKHINTSSISPVTPCSSSLGIVFSTFCATVRLLRTDSRVVSGSNQHHGKCALLSGRTVLTRSPAARCRCRGNKLSRVLFEHSSSFTVNLSAKTDLSTRNHHGDLLPHAGPLHLVCCVYLN